MTTIEKDKITGLYIAFFNRAPDKEGFNSWVEKLDNQTNTLNDIALGFSEHSTFESTYNHLSNEDFVKQIYKNILGRDGDTEGIAFHTKTLDDGDFLTKSDFIVSFTEMVQSVELTLENFPSLTSSELADAQLRQDLFQNKIEVSNKFMELLGDSTNVADNNNPNDPAYLASIKVLSDITEEKSSVDKAIEFIESAAADLDTAIDTILGDEESIDMTPTPPAPDFIESTVETIFNVINGTDNGERLLGTAAADEIYARGGDDTIRAGAGVDRVYAGDGDDTIVIIGDLSGGGKVDSVEDTTILGELLTNFNGTNLNEDEDGAAEIIDGGSGSDTLYVYGTADTSNFAITNIEHVEIRSDVLFSNEFLEAVSDINGDGSSSVRIVSKTGGAVEIDLATLNLTNIGHIDLGTNVTIKLDNLDQLGGAHILTGEGAIVGKANATITLDDTFTVETNLDIKDENGASVVGAAQVLDNVVTGESGLIQGTDGDDYLVGTDADDSFDTMNGSDVMTGKKGDDVFIISGTGNKIIIDSDEVNSSRGDTLDLSRGASGAVVDLTNGGTIGDNTTIQLGAGNTSGATGQDAPKNNVIIVIDTSGSMSNGTRMQDAKAAAVELIDAYDAIGDIAIRIIKFNSDATSSFNNNDSWLDVTTAKAIIDTFDSGGGTDYANAMDRVETAFSSGRGEVYFENGNNISYFLSDGLPNDPVVNKEEAWENFLIDNKIVSHAIGFGGLDNVTPLDPIAFDGTKVALFTDDHLPGEIDPMIEVDTSNLGTTLVQTAQLDFIENLIGTDFDDILTGNSLKNEIDGGKGDDIIIINATSIDTTGVGEKIVGNEGTDTLLIAGITAIDLSDDTIETVETLELTKDISRNTASVVEDITITAAQFNEFSTVNTDVDDKLRYTSLANATLTATNAIDNYSFELLSDSAVTISSFTSGTDKLTFKESVFSGGSTWSSNALVTTTDVESYAETTTELSSSAQDLNGSGETGTAGFVVVGASTGTDGVKVYYTTDMHAVTDSNSILMNTLLGINSDNIASTDFVGVGSESTTPTPTTTTVTTVSELDTLIEGDDTFVIIGGDIDASTKDMSQFTGEVTVSSGFTLTLRAADVGSVVYSGTGAVAITALDVTPAADLSNISTSTVTAAVDNSVTFTGDLGTATTTVATSMVLTAEQSVISTKTVDGTGSVNITDTNNTNAVNSSNITTATTIVGGAGADTITLGSSDNSVDTVVFADSATNNGTDIITGFVSGVSKDVLDFSAFNALAVDTQIGTAVGDSLDVTIASSIDVSSDTVNVIALNDIQTLDANNFGTTASETTIKIAADSKYLVLADATSDADNSINIYYVTTDSSSVAILELVGTVDTTMNSLVDSNFFGA